MQACGPAQGVGVVIILAGAGVGRAVNVRRAEAGPRARLAQAQLRSARSARRREPAAGV
jgi:hypothetical protein